VDGRERVQLVFSVLHHSVARFGHLVPRPRQVYERLGDDDPRLGRGSVILEAPESPSISSSKPSTTTSTSSSRSYFRSRGRGGTAEEGPNREEGSITRAWYSWTGTDGSIILGDCGWGRSGKEPHGPWPIR
jgi:hypothetical protein